MDGRKAGLEGPNRRRVAARSRAAHTFNGPLQAGTNAPRSLRVVVADDDDDMRNVLCELVSGVGAEVTPVSSGRDLIIALAEDPAVDLVVTDVRMPGMSGLQVAVSVRNSGIAFPIIMVTAFPDDTLRQQIGRLARTFLLEKPFRAEDFLSLVQSCLASSRAEA